ncbi:MAG: hypothetical protein ACK4N1_05285 [Pseudorhizobium sp.]
MSDESVKTIKASFSTRQAADLAIEHLTQEHGIDRSDVFVQASGSRNTSGTQPSGGDAPAPREGDGSDRTDGALEGDIEVSADVSQAQFAKAQAVFEDLGGRLTTS